MLLERELWFFLICALTIGGLIWGLVNTRRLIEAPFLYAVGMAIIICPQYYVATYHYWRVPDEAFRIFSIMVVLCTIALYWGYARGARWIQRQSYLPQHRWVVNDFNIFYLGLFIALAGAFGAIQVRLLGEIREWRGWPVYWVTLASLILPGISLILISYFQSRKLYRLIWASTFSIFPLLAITEYGRRSATLVLPFVYLLPLLIYKPKFRLPRWTVILALVASFVVVYAFPYWRGEFKEGRYLSVIGQKPLTEIVADIFQGQNSKILEVIDGMIVTGAYYVTNRYGLGINVVYNSLIQNYVPGGLIGREFKNSLFISQGISQDWVSSVYAIQVAPYTAKTAFMELFGEFSFFGCILCFYIGYFFRRIHDAAVFYFDGRAIIFLSFFITLPASLPYAGLLAGLVLKLPVIAIMIWSFSWCLHKQALLPNYYAYCNYLTDYQIEEKLENSNDK